MGRMVTLKMGCIPQRKLWRRDWRDGLKVSLVDSCAQLRQKYVKYDDHGIGNVVDENWWVKGNWNMEVVIGK